MIPIESKTVTGRYYILSVETTITSHMTTNDKYKAFACPSSLLPHHNPQAHRRTRLHF